MKITIVGTGGVGGYFGGLLANSGNEVTFIARGQHLETIKEKGLLVKSIKGDFVVRNAYVTSNLSSIQNPGLVIVAVKAWQVKGIADQLKTVVGENTAVLPLQNGILAAQELAKIIGKKYVINGICRIISKIEEPGVINHIGVEPTIIFGEFDNRKSGRSQLINKVFTEAAITNHIAKDIEVEAWQKFITICISGLMALTRSPYGAVLQNPGTRQLTKELFTEAFNVGKAAGVNLKGDFIEKTLAFHDTIPYHTYSSLARDAMEGKPSEIEYQNGTVVKLGEKYNIPTPVNRFIYNCILPMEKIARGIAQP